MVFYRIYRICISFSKQLKTVFYKFYRFCRIQFGETQMEEQLSFK